VVSGARPAGSFAIVNATAITMEPMRGRTSSLARVVDEDLGIVRDATILVEDGRIRALGPSSQVPAGVETIDAQHGVVMPGFVDAHTHALFAGDRIADFEAIAAGRKPALGIRYTVEQTRRCSPQELVDVGAQRLGLMAAHGTTTAEVKTGYALTADGEAAMLRAMRALDAMPAMPHVVPTFCGAHALPPEFDDVDAFVAELCGPILASVAATRIARFADAFCEPGYFTPAQCERFLLACAKAGMRLRIHADELKHGGGAALAAKIGCVSADHLNFVDRADIEGLARSGTVAVLCPATTEYLALDRFAPARDLIDTGVPVALATDFNPGTSPCPSLQAVAHLARRRLHMTASEVIAAITVQASRSLGAPGGFLIEGAAADLVILDTRDHREFGYYYGVNLVRLCAIGRPSPATPV
jgi:imidazolonepropionase